ncbi:MAG TPA: AI-2E family transporter [Gemmatimonadales bacterium]|nr:AI-2E family transporter [Gemmatimonadales bacterium]
MATDRLARASFALMGLFILALFYTIHAGRVFFLPIALAILLDFLLGPAVRQMKRVGIPEAIGAALILLALLLSLATSVYYLAEPAREWLATVPSSVRQAESKIRIFRRPMQQVSQTAEQVERATKVAPSSTPEVKVKGPGLAERLFGTTESIIAGAIEVVVLLYFLLASGERLLQKIARLLPHRRNREDAVAIAREAETSISRYLLTQSAINLGEGIVVAIAMALIGVPNPLIWGACTALVEYVPYVGATVLAGVLTLVGFTTFSSPAQIALVPGVFLAIVGVVANFVTPHVLGRHLLLSPLAVFVGLVFWSWIWGVPGTFLAVPLLATFRIVCDRVDSLKPVGALLKG